LGWNDEGTPSSREEILARVVGRGDQLRHRRRVATMAAVPVLLVAIFVPAALRGPDDGGTTVAASSPA